MKCPKCNINLSMTDRQGIEIDYCSECRGVWLDRGELDKIIEKSLTSSSPSFKATDDDYVKHRDYDDDKYYKQRKRKSLLGEIFDF